MRIEYESELYHHGIKGQKWGVRRYQNLDGTLTAAGRKRQAKLLSRQYNRATRAWTRADYQQTKNEKNAKIFRKISEVTDRGVLKPISMLARGAARIDEKYASMQAAKAAKQQQLGNAALEAAEASGFTAKHYTAWTQVDWYSDGYFTTTVMKKALQAKFTDPTQPKTREERRKEKDLNRIKNAAYEENQSLQRLREANAHAEQTVGSHPVKGYRHQSEWNDPQHEDVKKAKQAEREWMRSQERFADAYDRYKKRHPGTDKSLRDFAKMRDRNVYPVKKKYRT